MSRNNIRIKFQANLFSLSRFRNRFIPHRARTESRAAIGLGRAFAIPGVDQENGDDAGAGRVGRFLPLWISL